MPHLNCNNLHDGFNFSTHVTVLFSYLSFVKEDVGGSFLLVTHRGTDTDMADGADQAVAATTLRKNTVDQS